MLAASLWNRNAKFWGPAFLLSSTSSLMMETEQISKSLDLRENIARKDIVTFSHSKMF
jgi:hypothetical protein